MQCASADRKAIIESPGYRYVRMTAGGVAAVSIVVCVIALCILLDNHLRATVWELAFDRVTVLRPEAFHVLVSVAKWTGVIGGISLTVWGGLSTFKVAHSLL